MFTWLNYKGCLIGALLWGAISSFGAAPLFEDKVVARGQGWVVRLSEVEQAYIAFVATRASLGQQVPSAQKEQLERSILDRLITVQVLLQDLTQEERQKADQITRDYLKAAREKAASPAAYQRQIETAGMTPESFEVQLWERTAVEQVLDRELKSKVEVGEEAKRAFYQENQQDFKRPQIARVRHILMATMNSSTGRPLAAAEQQRKKELLEGLRQRVLMGEDIGKLAREYSEDRASRGNDGEAVFPRGSAPAEFEAAVFALGPGQLSEIVQTRYGFHLIQLQELEPEKLLTYEEVEPRLKALLQQKEFEARLPAYLEGKKAANGVEILEPRLAPQP